MLKSRKRKKCPPGCVKKPIRKASRKRRSVKRKASRKVSRKRRSVKRKVSRKRGSVKRKASRKRRSVKRKASRKMSRKRRSAKKKASRKRRSAKKKASRKRRSTKNKFRVKGGEHSRVGVRLQQRGRRTIRRTLTAEQRREQQRRLQAGALDAAAHRLDKLCPRNSRGQRQCGYIRRDDLRARYLRNVQPAILRDIICVQGMGIGISCDDLYDIMIASNKRIIKHEVDPDEKDSARRRLKWLFLLKADGLALRGRYPIGLTDAARINAQVQRVTDAASAAARAASHARGAGVRARLEEEARTEAERIRGKLLNRERLDYNEQLRLRDELSTLAVGGFGSVFLNNQDLVQNFMTPEILRKSGTRYLVNY